MNSISNYELELMKIIWANGGTALFAQIAEKLETKGYNWTKNTVITLLSRLIEKGLLETNKIGRKNKYIARVPETDYQAGQTTKFLDKFFEGNVRGLVSTLVERDMLSKEDYMYLKNYWEAGDRL